MTFPTGNPRVFPFLSRESLAGALTAAALADGCVGAAAYLLGASVSPFAYAAAGLGAAAFAARRARALARLDAQDPLTELPGRSEFRAELERRLAGGAVQDGMTVMNINLRRLREVNETHGHDAGDALLLVMTDRLRAMLPKDSYVARVGGDEFSAVTPPIACAERERLAGVIAESMTGSVGGAVAVQVAVGVATRSQSDAESGCARELLRRVDVALAQAKARNTPVTFYTARLSQELKSKKQLEDDLRYALAHDGLHVNYQPLFAIDGCTIVGAETLVRWIHPSLGFISPLTFVGLAEERGLMDQLGEFVLRRACLDARDWPDNLFVAVNVSPVQFRKEGFLDDVERILQETGLPPHRLELELTETAVVADEAKAEEMIIELRARGIRMALDDFGTGYSSLIYLRRFAFDKIKIDRSFLEALEPSGESAIIVESMVHLGKSLGLTVTAEGIETVEQHRFLQAIGCHELQGYLFSLPLALDAFTALLDAVEPSERKLHVA
jgi:diguanylate cyclase (GGDEF)-like protein